MKIQARLEKEFAQFIGVKYAVATSLGRNALFLILKSLNIKEGDEVIVPAFICSSVITAVRATGAKAVFADIGDDLCIDKEYVLRLINKKTKAVIVVHSYGSVAKIDEIKKICKGTIVIEDASQAIGARYKNKMAGSFSDISFYSLTKVMINFGGGIITTNSKYHFDNMLKIKRELLKKNKTSIRKVYDPAFRRIASSYESDCSLLPKFFIDSVRSILSLFYSNPKDCSIYPDFECSRMRAKTALKQIKKIDTNIIKRKRNYIYLKEELSGRYHFPKLNASSFNFMVIIPKDISQNSFLKRWKCLSKVWECNDPRYKKCSAISKSAVFFPINPAFRKSELNKIIDMLLRWR